MYEYYQVYIYISNNQWSSQVGKSTSLSFLLHTKCSKSLKLVIYSTHVLQFKEGISAHYVYNSIHSVAIMDWILIFSHGYADLGSRHGNSGWSLVGFIWFLEGSVLHFWHTPLSANQF